MLQIRLNRDCPCRFSITGYFQAVRIRFASRRRNALPDRLCAWTLVILHCVLLPWSPGSLCHAQEWKLVDLTGTSPAKGPKKAPNTQASSAPSVGLEEFSGFLSDRDWDGAAAAAQRGAGSVLVFSVQSHPGTDGHKLRADLPQGPGAMILATGSSQSAPAAADGRMFTTAVHPAGVAVGAVLIEQGYRAAIVSSNHLTTLGTLGGSKEAGHDAVDHARNLVGSRQAGPAAPRLVPVCRGTTP